MAGDVADLQYDEGADYIGYPAGIRVVTIAWTSDSGTGAVSVLTQKIVGMLVKAVTAPGNPAPDDNYDIVLTDPDGANILGNVQSNLLNRDTSSVEETYFFVKSADATPVATGVHPVVCSPVNVAITGAGNSKKGRLRLFFAPL